MGYMTSVIILIGCEKSENGKYTIAEKLNMYFYFPDSYYQPSDKIPPFQQMEEEYLYSRGGIGIFHGRFKGLERERFLEYLETLDWWMPDYVQVLLKPDNQMSYSLYTMQQGKFAERFQGELY
ncbi:MAG: hypothetical protein ACYDHX_08010 [Methanothrix sp.]